MVINYSDEKVIKSEKSIFLAGPLPRKEGVDNWRDEALKYLKKEGYSGVVYIPEKRNKKVVEGEIDEINWEMDAMSNAGKIVFWIPRSFPDLLGLTTNVEFGLWLSSKKMMYGRPDGAYMTEYLDVLYEKYYGKKAYNDLYFLLNDAIKE